MAAVIESKTPTAVTPLPRRQVFVVCAVLFAQTFSELLIFPFLPFMVHDFFPELEDDEIGYYAGWLGTCKLTWSTASFVHLSIFALFSNSCSQAAPSISVLCVSILLGVAWLIVLDVVL